MSGLRVVKGHGTENDFVVLPDLDGRLDLTPELTRALCDRHAGVGADGVLRVVRSGNDPAGKELAGDAEYFMDYRNADGSLAEMCGNGVRVFARYLQQAGLADGALAVGTRGGVKQVSFRADGAVTVDMGAPRLLAGQPLVTVGSAVHEVPGAAVEMPNPHVVVQLSDPVALRTLDLSRAPIVEPARPDGQNVEFVVREDERLLRMRVHERGVGETRSCGTGICAAVVAAATADGATTGDGSVWRVEVPGGVCEVIWRPDGAVLLTGPAVLVADLELTEEWLAGVRYP